jgi:cobalt-zinc-cadmium resistance protein CzcA
MSPIRQIVIITQWNGRSAEEVERFVTTPIELAMSPVQKKTSVRSTTMFGLSIVKILFEDGVDDIFARNMVNNQLRTVSFLKASTPKFSHLTDQPEKFFVIRWKVKTGIPEIY